MDRPNLTARVREIALPLLLVGAVPLFYVGGPPETALPPFRAIWNLGHIFFFGLLTIWILGRGPVKAAAGWKTLVLLSLGVLVLGLGIEWSQIALRRTPDWHDIWRNNLGVILGWSWTTAPSRSRNLVASAGLLFFAWELVSIGAVTWETLAIQKQLPVISALETLRDAEFWEGDVVLSREEAYAGSASLRVNLETGPYSGTGLYVMPRDWSGYEWLAFEVNNAGATPLRLTLRINDTEHDSSYKDRFNHRVDLVPGWNRVRVSLNEVRDAPLGRKMAMDRIYYLRVFASRLPEPRVVYLDDLRLE